MISRLPPQEAQDPLYFSGAEARGGRRQVCLMVGDFFYKVFGVNNLHAVKMFQFQQVIVSGDNIIGFGFKTAGKKLIVGRVFLILSV